MRKVLPCYFYNFRSCISLIDCFDIFIQRSLGLNSRAQSWLSYKNSNTIKYLMSITPTGSVSFCSEGWGGRVSDKQVTIQSGFLNILETGDLILADRGFRIEQEVATKGAILKVPAFTKGRSQLSAKEVNKSRQLANVRIHVERVIGRLKKFDILNVKLPISQVDLLDNIVFTICGLVNMSNSVVV
ncbi:uncharacterized protein LOC136086967 [Hydra vulgaris]|uniref:Uncharacterized protein LOC136086967 n=1 Tax=Hydra vulgaris TaxID=6087 RepID=A0ABM4CUD8_HYDVU